MTENKHEKCDKYDDIKNKVFIIMTRIGITIHINKGTAKNYIKRIALYFICKKKILVNDVSKSLEVIIKPCLERQ